MNSAHSNITALLSAIKEVDYKKTKNLLSKHGLPLDDHWNDYNLLIHALQAGSWEIVKLLLSHGCRVRRTKTNLFKTPLCYPVENYNLEMIRVLLEAGASIIDKDCNINTPLYSASNKQLLEAVDLMLSKYDLKNIDASNNDEIIHFFIACSRNNVNLVKAFINCGMNVNTYIDSNVGQWCGYSPLHIAVEHKSVEVVKVLLDSGADYTYLNAKILTPLHLAHCLEDSIEKSKIVDYILQMHAKNAINPCNTNGLSHFHLACTSNNKETIKNFLKAGVPVNSSTVSGFYPLHFAIINGHTEIIEMLLKHGARVNVKIKQGYLTPLHFAVLRKLPENSKLLLDYEADVCAENDCGRTPIHMAFYTLSNNSHEILNLMMSVHQGKMRNIVDNNGLSIFHIACAIGNTTAVANFLKRDVNVNAHLSINSSVFGGFTGLHFAAMLYHEDVIKLLLKYNVNVDALDKLGKSAICLAIQCRLTEKTIHKLNENFLRNKQSYEEAGVSEEEVLNFMHQEIKRVPVIKLLVKNECNFNLANRNSFPLLFNAYQSIVIIDKNSKIPNLEFIKSISEKYFHSCRKEIINILVKNRIFLNIQDSAKNSIFHFIAMDSDYIDTIEIAELLLNNGGNPNLKNNSSYTPLHLAVSFGFVEYIQLLLKYNANPNCRAMDLKTPLHLAANFRTTNRQVEDAYVRIMKILVANGADVDAKDILGCTPLFSAVLHTETVQRLLCLLKANCRVNIRNKEGHSPLLLAALKKNAFCVKLLLDYGADVNLTYKHNHGLLKSVYTKVGFLDFFDCCFIETFKILEIHIEKLRLINYRVNDSEWFYCFNVGLMLLNGFFTNFIVNIDDEEFDYDRLKIMKSRHSLIPFLEVELENMKTTMINAHTSLYDIIHESPKQMAKHVNNPIFKECLEPERFNVDFQHFGYILKLKYKQGLARYMLLETAKESLRQLAQVNVPDLCLDQIFIYLSNKNLQTLIDVYARK